MNCSNCGYINKNSYNFCVKCGQKLSMHIAQEPNTIDTYEKTVAQWEGEINNVEHVVGWLVCIEGAYIGQSFEIKLGNNNIGTDAMADISLPLLKGISSKRDCVISFNPINREFFLQEAENQNKIMLNYVELSGYAPIKRRDIMMIGNANFMFMPLCGTNFGW